MTAITRTASPFSESVPIRSAGLAGGRTTGRCCSSSDDGFVVSKPRSFMHQQYLWIWMRAGLIGLLALIALLAFGDLERRALVSSAGMERKMPGWERASSCRVVAMAASSNVGDLPHTTRLDGALVGVLALAAVMRREPAHDGSSRTADARARRRRRQLPQRAADRADVAIADEFAGAGGAPDRGRQLPR